ncbi:DUF2029 domain-containing protein [Roseomonas sp. HJA6]|uniref:DUF2029 domain-containing protein n=1 Tax=Roseomonas alba TaxID=2846776 RepID=A0ABS7A971_9PROT|nr:glycosyltransferase family 87 protein [Neoroseomonas alba]MBW6397729.1 DUF2029 domain-containing protein [Neoroseomonas alba]
MLREEGGRRLVAADVAALVYLLALTLVLAQALGLAGGGGTAFIGDFTVFWTAGRAAAAGQAMAIYDGAWFVDFAERLMGRPVSGALLWRNPPGFLFVVTPIAMLPYGWAWLCWTLVTAGGFIWTLRRVTQDWRILLLALLAPAALFCAMLGQNGFLTAMLAGLAMHWLDRRPVAAGLCLALLTYKPQFGAILPVLLLLGRRWTTFIAASLGSIGCVLLTEMVFGRGIWLAFVQSLSNAVGTLAMSDGQPVFFYHAVQTALRSLGVPGVVAWGVHIAVALLAIGVAVHFWRRDGSAQAELRAVATFGAMMLVTPYVLIYDQVLLGMAVAFLARAAQRQGGWLPGEAPLAMVACLLPGVALAGKAFFAGPLAWVILLTLVIRRDAVTQRAGEHSYIE